MSFGQQPIANAFLTSDQIDDEYFYEMEVAYCSGCGMFQLVDQPAPEVMFHDNYAFFSQTSKGMQVHFEGFAKSVMANRLSTEAPFVVEIGSNDGIMLRHFVASGIRSLGIEPSGNVAAQARGIGIDTISEFFGLELAKKIRAEHGPADTILGANVFCHIPSIRDITAGVAELLKPEGLLIFEDPYLGDVIEKTSYDQIYDEHVFLFSLHSVSNAYRRVGLDVVDVAPQEVHGGSMRYYVGDPKVHGVSGRVDEQHRIEEEIGLAKPETYAQFRKNCESSRMALKQLLENIKADGKRIAGYGATSKSSTITAYSGIGPDLIPFISDTTPIKQNKLSPGSHIPVLPYDHFTANMPDYAVLFAWNHAKEIMANESAYLAQGGKWIVHVPEVAIL